MKYSLILGYLLMRLESDLNFDLVSKGLIWQLSAPDSLRGHGTVQLRHTLAAGIPMLYQPIARMLSIVSTHRYPTFLHISLLLACDTVNNCTLFFNSLLIYFYIFPEFFKTLLSAHNYVKLCINNGICLCPRYTQT